MEFLSKDGVIGWIIENLRQDNTMFRLTKAGRTAILDATNKGITMRLHTITLGTARYVSTDNDNRTALTSPIITAPLSVRQTSDKGLYLTASIRHSSRLDVYEIGLLSQSGVLIALASRADTPLFTLPANETQTLNLAVRV